MFFSVCGWCYWCDQSTWGTPDITDTVSEWEPFTETNWRRWERKALIQSRVLLSLYGIRVQLSNSLGCDTVSNALEKSKRIAFTWPFLLSTETQSWTVRINWVSQEKPRLKPCWRSVKMLFTASNLFRWQRTTCSITLQQVQPTQVKDTGL